MNHIEAVETAIDSIANANVRDLSELLQQLVRLRTSEPEDEYGVLRPTDYAFEMATQLLVDVSIELKVSFRASVPYGCASTDSAGGIRIDWFRSDCAVNLVIPANEQQRPYIYHQLDADHAVEYEVTPERLATWLRIIND